MADSEVKQDIQEAKVTESVNVKMTDGKIVCDFNIYDQTTENMNESYTSYPKVFDNWDGFVAYAKKFFPKPNNSSK